MTNNVVTPYNPEEKKKEQSEKTTDDNNAEKSPPQSEDNTTDGNAGGGKRRMRERSPIVKDRGVTGTVKWFSMRKGYGFIHRDDVDEDLFFHTSSIVRQTRQPLFLPDNQKVEFDIIKGIKGLEAQCVSGPDGNRVGTYLNPFAFRKGVMMPFRRRSEGDTAAGHQQGGGGGKRAPMKTIPDANNNQQQRQRKEDNKPKKRFFRNKRGANKAKGKAPVSSVSGASTIDWDMKNAMEAEEADKENQEVEINNNKMVAAN